MSASQTKNTRDESRGNILTNHTWSNGPDSDDELARENELLNENMVSPSHRRLTVEEQSAYNMTLFTEGKMRRKLKFFFMNPIEKWQAKRRLPYKFAVQVIKIVLVTVQLCLFAHNNYMHVNYAWDNRIAFSHLFLKGWDATQEVALYPPATGPLAIYKKDDFYRTIDYALDGYYNLSNAIGSYSYTAEDNSVDTVVLCLYHYKEGIIFGFNESYVFDKEIIEVCINITTESYNLMDTSKRLLRENQININFSALVRAHLKFALKTVNLKAAGPMTPPDCYQFNITINFDNRDFDGQMLLSLDAKPVRLQCKGDTRYVTNNRIESTLRTLLNLLVIFICTLSLSLCSRAIYRAQLLKYETMNFFMKTYGKTLSFEGRLEFLNLWYVMIIVNDLLIIIGSALKEKIERKQFGTDYWNVCSIFLGTGNLLVWFGVLRYLGFFKTYNVVILTLKKAAPKVARFLICAILIYAGFTFCGWLILGPYHMKFTSLASTSECLFALINGDDMFATFSMTSFESPMLWWYSRIYLYSFISLYIYVVLSLFISVIMDAYDTIKVYYRDGFPKNDLQTFIAACTDKASSGLYRDDSEKSDLSMLLDRFCCCRKSPFYGSVSGSSTEFSTKSDQTCGTAVCI
ncbi:Mucolipin-3 [Habropoda laboriosa]|uniref:Mucolipin-3 n=1 Tax=Habropoda laboriosa TaxID=597456 RepID=A0A0L7QRA5_9HYME|nr:PREDICTED: mucolipin-3-like [Habropoda laboriosa]XP_017794584.1 PREDICTED: mucolipin-3-like [Habropoda laboriosa]XP_017794585.1 PREDICTED: mucolipin-3-like [Habropoda laboriosa]XP_017794586.1 PREDICTED: mucolipin-3-like [Habropoda laboriosa]KOC61158.1 Mucolipin-3 [Habropoda laboriosa]